MKIQRPLHDPHDLSAGARVRRGWNRVETRGRASNLPAGEIEKKQQTFMFGAGLLYAIPFLLPIVKYIYRSIDELSRYVGDLSVFTNLPAFVVVLVVTELFLAVVIYNLLGIYVDRMNSALGFFRKIGRSVMDGSRVAVQAGGNAGGRAATGVRDAAVVVVLTGRAVVIQGAASARRTAARVVRPATGLLSRLGRSSPAGFLLMRVRGVGEPPATAASPGAVDDTRRAA